MAIFLKRKYKSLIGICFFLFPSQVLLGFDVQEDKTNKDIILTKASSQNYLNNLPNDQIIKLNNFLQIIAENIDELELKESNLTNQIEITSNKQINTDKEFIAEGDVFVKKNNLILKSDKLIYNSKDNLLIVIGNINFEGESQFFRASEINYDVTSKKGYIKDVYGSINFDTLSLINLNQNKKINLNSKFNKDSDIRNVYLTNSSMLKLEGIKFKDNNKNIIGRLRPEKFKLDVNEFQQWRFKTERINIDNNTWNSEKFYLTNDPFNKPQIVIENNFFKVVNNEGNITLSSKWSSIILDNKLRIPIGPRKDNLKDNKAKWSIGYDQPEKDGFFISRNSDKLIINQNTTLDLKNEFYLQRAILGNTKSFSREGESILATKEKQDSKLQDYFGLESRLNSKIFDFGFKSLIKLNSLDVNKFKKIISINNELSSNLFKENRDNRKSSTDLIFFQNYRNKVWNGSLGEREIINAYGTKIIREINWSRNNITKNALIAASYGYFESEAKDRPLELINRRRVNLFLQRNNKYPIITPLVDKSINKSNVYSPIVNNKGLYLYLNSEVDLYRYDDDSYQNLFTIKLGPEIILGDFKKRFFDYTQLSILPKATISRGQSPFSFDQAVDKLNVEFKIDQQIFGPLTFKYSSLYNLDENSDKYKEFINSKYEIGWNRRAYKVAIYYDDQQQKGGFTFSINSFKFEGLGKNF